MKTEEVIVSGPMNLISSVLAVDMASMLVIFLFVMVVDRTFFKDKLHDPKDPRAIYLPLIALLCGGLYYIISNPFEYKSLEQFRILFFSGMKTGAATTVTYSIAKKGFVNRLKSLYKKEQETK